MKIRIEIMSIAALTLIVMISCFGCSAEVKRPNDADLMAFKV